MTLNLSRVVFINIWISNAIIMIGFKAIITIKQITIFVECTTKIASW